MEYFIGYIKTMLKKLIIFALIITMLLAFFGYANLISGWLIGSLLNVVYFLMLSNRSARMLDIEPAKAVAFMRVGAFIRLATIFLALVVVLQFPSISFGAAVAGVFLFRLYTYLEVLAKSVYARLEGR